MRADKRIEEYFEGRIKQVFVYLTSRCQLHCRQCLYKPLLSSKNDDLLFEKLIELLSLFKKYGAFKLSFLGGEPTLYHDSSTQKSFADIVAESKRLGYSLVRADTNGQFDEKFLVNNDVRKLDEITFSLDGSIAEIHDKIRGKNGVFQKCVTRIHQAVELGYRVQVTSCVHREICGDVKSGVEQIENMVRFCDSLGVHSLNFHPILKVGVARDNWLDDTEIEPHVWLQVYREVISRLDSMEHRVEVRLPMRYIESGLYTDEYDYCPLKMGERLLIMPDGQLKVCAFNIGTPFCVARFNNESIEYELQYNEIEKLRKSRFICCNQSAPEGLQALCMSYKPNQNEAVWCSIRGNDTICRLTS